MDYHRKDLEAPAEGVSGASDVKRWETVRLIEDKVEFAKARAAQSAATSTISKVCVPTELGLFCPAARERSLDEAIRLARAVAAEHNRDAKTAFVVVRVVKARVDADDEGAAEEIVGEADRRLAEAGAALEAGDVDGARAAATRAKGLADLLAASTAERVLAAVKAARERAKAIKKGEG